MHQMLEKKPGLVFTQADFQSELVSRPVYYSLQSRFAKTFLPTSGEKLVCQHQRTAKILFHVAGI